MSKIPEPGKLTARERQLVLLYRGIESKHERNAFVLLMASIACGELTSLADKKKLDSLLDVY
jgi:hypothetical protein